jgi:hypothetical protein
MPVGIVPSMRPYPNLKVATGLVIAPCERLERISEDAVAMPWGLG